MRGAAAQLADLTEHGLEGPTSAPTRISAMSSRPPQPSILQFLASAILFAALLATGLPTAGCRSGPKQEVALANGTPDQGDVPQEAENETKVPITADSYQAIAQRDVFRALVANPRGTGAESGASGGTSAPQTRAPQPSSPRPSAPPDPTEDIALTGIIETTDGLDVLVESVSTGKGMFAGIGDTVFGFDVAAIGPGTVTLKQGDKSYTLRLGEKEIAPHETPAASTSSSSGSGASSTSDASSGTQSNGGMQDMRSMSSDERRRYWESLSDEQRQQMRDQMRQRYGGRGRGGFRGGSRGGPGGGFRGRGGR
jgi:hypothetical protein